MQFEVEENTINGVTRIQTFTWTFTWSNTWTIIGEKIVISSVTNW